MNILKHFRPVKGPVRSGLLPSIIFGNTVEAIDYEDALGRIRNLLKVLTSKPMSSADRSNGQWFWSTMYILALYAQERMIDLINDDLIASDIPWDLGADMPLVSSTVGDAVSYAERLRNPEDCFLKALLLSLSGWALLSTEKKECACNGGKLQEVLVDVLAQTSLKTG